MKIKDFKHKYPSEQKPISDILNKWSAEKTVKDLLQLSLAPGIVLADIFIGKGFIDVEIPSHLIKAFESAISGGKCDTYDEVKIHLIKKILSGDESIHGTINHIQGYVGEELFKNASNGAIKLSHLSNQEAVDAVREIDGVKEYIQVKVYSDSNKVIKKMIEANEKIETGNVYWKNPDGSQDLLTDPPTFAINKEIYDEVVKKAAEKGLPNNIINMNLSSENIRDSLEGIVVDVKSEFFGSLATPILMATTIQAFFSWYKYRNIDQILSSLPKNVAINTAGALGGMAGRAGALAFTETAIVTEAALLLELEVLSCFISPIGGIALAYIARGLTTRVTERTSTAKALLEGNKRLMAYIKQAA